MADPRQVPWVAEDGSLFARDGVLQQFPGGSRLVRDGVAFNIGQPLAEHLTALQEAHLAEAVDPNPLEVLVCWRPFPAELPDPLPWGRYARYLVALDDGQVLECSWLNGGWHERHDGCSERTLWVRYWMPRPPAPAKAKGAAHD